MLGWHKKYRVKLNFSFRKPIMLYWSFLPPFPAGQKNSSCILTWTKKMPICALRGPKPPLKIGHNRKWKLFTYRSRHKNSSFVYLPRLKHVVNIFPTKITPKIKSKWKKSLIGIFELNTNKHKNLSPTPQVKRRNCCFCHSLVLILMIILIKTKSNK